jgi:hypothetical protein
LFAPAFFGVGGSMKRILVSFPRALARNWIARGGTATLFLGLAGLLLMSFGFAMPAEADNTVVSVSNGNPVAGGIVVASVEYLQESWSQSTGLTDVSISAWLFGPVGPGGLVPQAGTAYLTSSVLGEPELMQTFVFPGPGSSDGPGDLTLFSGLTLPEGTYYLTVASTDLPGGAWVDCYEQPPASPCTATLASGVTLAYGTASHSCPSCGDPLDPANPPLSFFSPTVPNDYFMFAVTTTPEPSSIVLFGSGCLFLGFVILGRRRFAN